MGKVRNLWCSDYWKLHFKVKKLKVDIFTRAVPPQETSPRAGFYHHSISSGRGKLLIPQAAIFLENLFPPAEREGGEESVVSLDLHSLKPNI